MRGIVRCPLFEVWERLTGWVGNSSAAQPLAGEYYGLRGPTAGGWIASVRSVQASHASCTEQVQLSASQCAA